MTERTNLVNILQGDPELGRRLEPGRARSASREALAPVISVSKGLFSASETIPGECGTLGVLVLEGFVLRAVSVSAQPSLEVLGPGDVFRLEPARDRCETVSSRVGWWGLRPARLAVLDASFVGSVSEYPELLGELMGRLWRRSTASSLRLAIVQQPRLSVRLHFMLWHLFDRFGRWEGGTAVVPVPLCHTLLSWLVVASRPAVSRAMKELQRSGLIECRADGSWRLGRQAPEGFAELAQLPAQPLAA